MTAIAMAQCCSTTSLKTVEGVCGMANLVHAKCSAESNQAIEDCTCQPSFYGGPGEEFCHETADKGTKTRKDVDRDGHFSTIKCSLAKKAKKLQNCGLDQNEICGSPSAVRNDPIVQEGASNLRLMGVAAGLLAMIGTTPPVIAAIAKLQGKETLETTCTHDWSMHHHLFWIPWYSSHVRASVHVWRRVPRTLH